MPDGLILVTGGTGGLGRRVIPRLRQAGRPIRVLSRRPHESSEEVEFVAGDLLRDQGIAEAVAGVETIVHCAGSMQGDEVMTRNLIRAVSRTDLHHLVFISVVGCDRIPVKSAIDRAMFSYFASKAATERVVAASGVPWTTLRATQFHEGFMLVTVRAMAKLPLIPVPAGVRFQPVDTDEVAARTVELALGPPVGLAPDFGGPEIHALADLLRLYLRAIGKHRLTFPVGVPGAAARAVRAGAILAPDHAEGKRTWEEFLNEHAAANRAGSS